MQGGGAQRNSWIFQGKFNPGPKIFESSMDEFQEFPTKRILLNAYCGGGKSLKNKQACSKRIPNFSCCV